MLLDMFQGKIPLHIINNNALHSLYDQMVVKWSFPTLHMQKNRMHMLSLQIGFT